MLSFFGGDNLEDYKNHIGFKIRCLANLIKRHRENAGANGATRIQMWIIRYVYESENGVFQRNIEEKFNMRPSSASVVLSSMEKAGFIKRVCSKDDARKKQIILTKRALEIEKDAEHEIELLENRMKKGISKEELECFFAVCEKIAENLEVKQ